jgi:hypothetical protein
MNSFRLKREPGHFLKISVLIINLAGNSCGLANKLGLSPDRRCGLRGICLFYKYFVPNGLPQ